LHCPGITIEDMRKLDLLAELIGVMSDGSFPRFVDPYITCIITTV
jgi:hypothetical protein